MTLPAFVSPPDLVPPTDSAACLLLPSSWDEREGCQQIANRAVPSPLAAHLPAELAGSSLSLEIVLDECSLGKLTRMTRPPLSSAKGTGVEQDRHGCCFEPGLCLLFCQPLVAGWLELVNRAVLMGQGQGLAASCCS